MADLEKVLAKGLHRTTSMYKDIGIVDDQELQARNQVLVRAVEAAVNSVVDSLASERQNLESMCEAKQLEIVSKREKLSDVDFGICVRPIEPPLRQLAHQLEEAHNEIESVFCQREKRFYEAVIKYNSLCRTLGEQPEEDPVDLTMSTIHGLEQTVSCFERRKQERLVLFKDLVDRVLSLQQELGIFDVANTLKGELESESPCLTASGLDELRKEVKALEVIKTERQSEIDELLNTCRHLWQMLEIPDAVQKAFEASHTGLTLPVISAYKQELVRLEQDKIAHMAKFITNTRVRLSDLWTQLYFSEEQRHDFLPAFTEEFTEDSLNLHQDEVKRLENLVLQSKNILIAIKDLNDIKDQEVKLQLASKNPARLKQRGSILLEEEKMRKRVAKRKPALLAFLDKLLTRWEDTQGKPFLVYGKRYLDSICEEQAQILKKPTRLAISSQKHAATVHDNRPTKRGLISQSQDAQLKIRKVADTTRMLPSKESVPHHRPLQRVPSSIVTAVPRARAVISPSISRNNSESRRIRQANVLRPASAPNTNKVPVPDPKRPFSQGKENAVGDDEVYARWKARAIQRLQNRRISEIE